MMQSMFGFIGTEVAVITKLHSSVVKSAKFQTQHVEKMVMHHKHRRDTWQQSVILTAAQLLCFGV